MSDKDKPVHPSFYTKNYFLRSCEGWKHWLKSEELSPRLKHAFSLLNITKDTYLLDFGCGRGEMTIKTAQKGARVLAIDYSKNALSLFKKSLQKLDRETKSRISVRKTNVESLKLKPNSFDHVLFLDVFEHLTDQQLKTILKKFHQCLKPGGKILIHTAPNKNFLNYGYSFYTRWLNTILNPLWKFLFQETLRTSKQFQTPDERKVHINEQTPKTLKNWLKNSGFQSRVWSDSSFHLIRLRDRLDFSLLRPVWIPFLRRFFVYDLWAIAIKPIT